jgi:hypothetical protein
MPEVENALPSGYSINEYRIDFLLGAGGFGLTYLATDANLNLKVALKEFLPADLAVRGADSTVQPKSSSAADSLKWGLQRFMEEARTLASFRHPNIVRVMRFFEANHTGYMVMEFVDGTALPDWIQPRRPLPAGGGARARRPVAGRAGGDPQGGLPASRYQACERFHPQRRPHRSCSISGPRGS